MWILKFLEGRPFLFENSSASKKLPTRRLSTCESWFFWKAELFVFGRAPPFKKLPTRRFSKWGSWISWRAELFFFGWAPPSKSSKIHTCWILTGAISWWAEFSKKESSALYVLRKIKPLPATLIRHGHVFQYFLLVKKPLARNADPRRTISCGTRFLADKSPCQERRCETDRVLLFSRTCFSQRTQKLGTLIRDLLLFSREFSSYPKAPPRDVNPRRIIFVWDLLARRKGSCKERWSDTDNCQGCVHPRNKSSGSKADPRWNVFSWDVYHNSGM